MSRQLVNKRGGINSSAKINFRLYVSFLVLAVFGFVLWARVIWVQVFWGPSLARQARSQYVVKVKEQGYRGKILDRNGVVLAQSIRTYSVFARPKEIKHRYAVSKVLGKLLRQDYRVILKKLKKQTNFVWIKRNISDAVAERIRNKKIKGVYLVQEYARIYPQGHLLGQVLGFTNVDGKGLEGIEKSFDDFLRGKVKGEVVFRDARGRLVSFALRPKNLNGQDVQLSIDSNLQARAEEILARRVEQFRAKSGQLIVVKVKTGEILALANYPFFNPNIYFKTPAIYRKNRAALDLFEPGSTAKTFLIASALEAGVCKPNSVYFCEQGKWHLTKKITIEDTHKYGWLSVASILKYSSNIGAGKIALQLGKHRYFEFLKKLGFTRKVDLPLPGRAKSLFQPLKKWGDVELVTAAFGQGWSTTGLHLIQAYLALADGGEFRPLRLVVSPELKKQDSYRVFSQNTVRQVLKMLWSVVNEDGTGKMLKLKEINLGGKTGTAQKPNSVKRGYKQGSYVSSFMGIVPVDRPKYLIFMLIDEPKGSHYGSVVAGPGVRTMALALGMFDNSIFQRRIKVAVNEQRKGKIKMPAFKGRVMPDCRGKSLRYALDRLVRAGVKPVFKGKGLFVVEQSIPAGTPLKKGSKVFLRLGEVK